MSQDSIAEEIAREFVATDESTLVYRNIYPNLDQAKKSVEKRYGTKRRNS
jgi:hypothetical protein